jgi:tRNA threonylcarbamoyladenosine biosynthesis protein TsaE
MKFISTSLDQTREVATRLIDSLEFGGRALVVALHGDLGAGKTAFTQEVGKILGVEENMHSPTFVIEKIYPINYKGFKNLIHIDAYRIEKESELLHLGWEEITSEPENLIFIEWPERVERIIPKDAINVKFTFIDETTREIETEARITKHESRLDS